MNLKLVLRTYSALRQLTGDEAALLETLRNFNDSEREAFVEALSDKPAGKKTTTSTRRKIEHCTACDYTKRALVHKDPNANGYHEFQSAKGEKKPSKSAQSSSKSPRATGIEQQLSKRREQGREIADKNDHCMHELSYGPCLLSADDNIHHLSMHPNYHEFDEGKHDAPPATTRSPANDGATTSTANSATETEDVSNAVHAGG